jgi:CHAT domain
LRLIDILPNYKSYIPEHSGLNLEEECMLSNSAYVKSLSEKLLAIQLREYNYSGGRELVNISFSLLKDVINAKDLVNDPNERVVLNKLQFMTTFFPLQFYADQKNMGEAYDWITYSFCDNLEKEQSKDLEYYRIVEFTNAPLVSQVLNHKLVCQWIGNFYYVCRCYSAFLQVATELMAWGVTTCNQKVNSDDFDAFGWPFLNITCWAANNGDHRIRDLVSVIELGLEKATMPERLKLDFLYCLSTLAGNYSSKKPWKWAKQALNEYSKLMDGHLKLHFMLNASNVVDEEFLDEYAISIIEEIKIVKEMEVDKHEIDGTNILKRTERLIDLISPFIGTCIDSRQGFFAISVLKHWYLKDVHGSINFDDVLLFYPNTMGSIKYLIGGESYGYYRRQTRHLEAVVAGANKFLGISISAGMLPNFKLNIPARFGFPDERFSTEFERSLVDFYAIDFLQKKIENKIGSLKCMISLPSYQHPLQYLTTKYLGSSFPITASLKIPKSDRKITKVCLWSGAGSITEEIEIGVIESIFGTKNIELSIFTSKNSSKSSFKRIYESDEFDVIWIMSHGEYDHWKTGDIKISISDKESISLNEMIELSSPVKLKRRFLFLNVCDGAAFASLGGLQKIGFAPALASANQCVLSHLWPVNPWAAALFGALVAINLSQEGDYFKAYNVALETMMLENELIYSFLAGALGAENEFIRRLKNQNISFKEMVHAGSAAFFQ